jgi:hypothetical protein
VITQENARMGDPKQHLAWAMRLMPTVAGVGAVTNSAILAEWSKHLYLCGFRHVSAIAALANADGYIHVDQLPKQQIRLAEAFRGPRNAFNAAARWVPMDAPDPEPISVPDIQEFTPNEREAVLAQFRDTGHYVDRYAPPPDVASVSYE